ncbi:transglutaminase family protein [Demequina globuliformis]|uniref:transglutaminase family protein n=1 Tax=Demequina globuliformis TaxID=676202 RepID=UPI00078337A1|nr:transglutaminase family protein [Demequina globuliformis]
MTTMRIEHTTRFRYAAEIGSSYNEARVVPAWLPRQRVLDSRVSITPVTWRSSYRDYWECDVTVFEVLQPHTSLTVAASSVVEVASSPPRGEKAGWEALEGPKLRDLLCEYLDNSAATAPPDALADFARDASHRLGPDSTARAICEYLHSEVRYVPGVTSVHSTAQDAWEGRSGVCQDMAQLAIGALREIGIPARYVSGYLHPSRDASIGETVEGESHAWIEWWSGEWTGFDPTNDREVGDHHVIVGRAREYRDIPPLAGVVAGATEDLDVTVKVTQTA